MRGKTAAGILPWNSENKRQIETVTAAPGLLQAESAAIKDTIEQQQVIDLPLKGRNFIDLVALTPGVTNPPAGTRGSALQQTGKTYGILGQRGGHNLYLVDGVSVTDEAFNNMVLSPSVDDVQEVNINQTSYDAEFGGKSGGVINVITKSGSNGFHGSVFEFVRNDIFDAKNFFVSPTAAQAALSSKTNSARRSAARFRRTRHFSSSITRASESAKSQTQLVHCSDRRWSGPATSRDRGSQSTFRARRRLMPNDTIPASRSRGRRHTGKSSTAEPRRDCEQQSERNGTLHHGCQPIQRPDRPYVQLERQCFRSHVRFSTPTNFFRSDRRR